MELKNNEATINFKEDNIMDYLDEKEIKKRSMYMVKCEDIVLDIYSTLKDLYEGTIENKVTNLEITFNNKQKFKVNVENL